MSVEGPDAARAAEIDSELGTLHARLATLYGERASLITPAESLGAVSVNGAGRELDWLADDYDAATASLPDLGFTERQMQEVPALERVEAALAPVAVWLGARARAGHQHEVIIEPSVRKIGLMGSNRWPGLIPRFDRLQGEADQTVVAPLVWPLFDDKDPYHDAAETPHAPGLFSVAILLGDVRHPLNAQEPANAHGDPGGVYPGYCADEQQLALVAEKTVHAAAGRSIEGVTIGQVIAVNNKRRHAGQAFLSSGIATRLLHYPPQRDAGYDKPTRVPAVRSVGQRQELGFSDVEAADDDVVIRRVLLLDV